MNRKSPTFLDGGKRRVRCPDCNSVLAKKGKGVIETRLTDDWERPYKCYKCGCRFIIYSPQKTTEEIKRIIYTTNVID